MKQRKNKLKNSKSQTCFEKNLISSSSNLNRLHKIKLTLDKQQRIINEINNIKQKIEEKPKGIRQALSRTMRRKTELYPLNKENKHPKLNCSRSRSKTDFNPQLQKKGESKKTSNKMYALKEQNSHKLSRNGIKEPMTLKTKSYLKPTVSSNSSVYRTNMNAESYSTFGTNKSNSEKTKSGGSVNKHKYSKILKNSSNRKSVKETKDYPFVNNIRQINLAENNSTYKENYSIKKNITTLLKAKSQDRDNR